MKLAILCKNKISIEIHTTKEQIINDNMYIK